MIVVGDRFRFYALVAAVAEAVHILVPCPQVAPAEEEASVPGPCRMVDRGIEVEALASGGPSLQSKNIRTIHG